MYQVNLLLFQFKNVSISHSCRHVHHQEPQDLAHNEHKPFILSGMPQPQGDHQSQNTVYLLWRSSKIWEAIQWYYHNWAYLQAMSEVCTVEKLIFQLTCALTLRQLRFKFISSARTKTSYTGDRANNLRDHWLLHFSFFNIKYINIDIHYVYGLNCSFSSLIWVKVVCTLLMRLKKSFIKF